ncbi:putative glycolipid-binding domain-containing protein [Pseudogulbenkiania sp. MAI-1]|uniref:putative glycolipid-binding domain-containing protein n=1 Tax=Pseudogulbenkiania sp. MAI-1 TaxID=990370 RepID=UPI00045E6D41|nr:putative glycolipid-binding domain-containing protein [Pseudogulbenkiania sp. MAI-1]
MTWQHLAASGREQVNVSLGVGLTLVACGTLCHEDTGTLLSYRMCTNRKGWVNQVVIDAAMPLNAKLKLQRRTDGRWLINDLERPEFDGCTEFDLQCSGLTISFPIRRLKLEVGEHQERASLFIRLPQLVLEICQQSYTRLPDQNGKARYLYRSPVYSSEITVDALGLAEHVGGLLHRVRHA